MTTTKKRGRPPGSSRKNEEDFRLLKQVADRMVREPSLKLTTAMKAIGVIGEADQRRLREKWGDKSEEYLTAARSRLQQERQAAFDAAREHFARETLAAARAVNDLASAANDKFQRWLRDNPKAVENIASVSRIFRDLERKGGTSRILPVYGAKKR